MFGAGLPAGKSWHELRGLSKTATRYVACCWLLLAQHGSQQVVLGLRERAEQRIPLQELGYTLQIVQHSQASKGDSALQVCSPGPVAA